MTDSIVALINELFPDLPEERRAALKKRILLIYAELKNEVKEDIRFEMEVQQAILQKKDDKKGSDDLTFGNFELKI